MVGIKDPMVALFSEQLGIESQDLEEFFNVLSDYGEHPVDLETFVVGCIKMRGMAKSIDMVETIINVQRGFREVHTVQSSMGDQLWHIATEVMSLNRTVAALSLPIKEAHGAKAEIDERI